MRAILGKPDCPDSSYILVLRGIDMDSAEYFARHVKEYPTWGCLVFPDVGERLMVPFTVGNTSIHKRFAGTGYSAVSDENLIKWVKETFPPFIEDEEDTSSDKVEKSGVYPTADFCKEVKTLSAIRSISLEEIYHALFSKDEFIHREVEMCKSEIVRKLLAIPEFWDVRISEDAHFHTTIQVRFAAGVMKCERPTPDSIRELSDSVREFETSLRGVPDFGLFKPSIK